MSVFYELDTISSYVYRENRDVVTENTYNSLIHIRQYLRLHVCEESMSYFDENFSAFKVLSILLHTKFTCH